MPSASHDLIQAMTEVADKVEDLLNQLLPQTDMREKPLFDAARYACLGGGKRLRPFLLMSAASLFGVAEPRALRAAAAIEMIHSYSLVHDDLPEMDNADLRRGKPTVWRAFDHATATLAGDGLLTYAFEVLADPQTHDDPKIRCLLVTALARAAGMNGMVGGQMVDLVAEKTKFDIGEITRLQRMKTGELIAAACGMGAILGRASAPYEHALHAYAHDLGLAFQIADDLLDVEGTEEETGKSVQRDAEAGKETFVSILGIERAREQAQMLSRQAIEHLTIFDGRAKDLEHVALFVVERKK